MTSHIFRIAYGGDFFEVTTIRTAGGTLLIARITCYLGGSHRQDMQYEDLPSEVQEGILKKINSSLNDEE